MPEWITSRPSDLYPLPPDGDGAGRTLPAELQPGRLVRSDKGTGEPAFWLSDGVADLWLWIRLLAEHASTGFWPVLVGPEDEDDGPWAAGEFSFDNVSAPADHDPQALLREWWHRDVVPDPVDTAPFGEHWPDDPAPTPRYQRDPVDSAENLGGSMLYDYPLRLGVRVVALEGSHTLNLSVAAPPANHDEALRVAAEHFAFCPDPFGWELFDTTLAGYAETLIDKPIWIFNWD